MKIYLLAGIDFFRFDDSNDFEVHGFTYRSNDSIGALKEMIPNQEIWESIGTSSLNQFANTPYFFKAVQMVPNGGYEETAGALTILEDMFEFLWYIKDNSTKISFFTGYNEFHKSVVGKFPSAPFTLSDGTLKVTGFTKTDLNYAFDLYIKYLQFTNIYKKLADSKITEIESSKGKNIALSDFSYHDLSRIDRAIAFINNARTSKYLFAKVALYAGALECLFSAGDRNEVQHKVGERVAIYIGNDYADKMRIYKEYKVAYDIRSKYVHGQDMEGYIGSKEKNLINASINMDNLLRQILVKIIEKDNDKFLLKTDEQKEWFNSNLFK